MQNIENLALRLKNERKVFGKPVWEIGFKHGIEDAYIMSFEDIYLISKHIGLATSEDFFETYSSSERKKKITNSPEEESGELMDEIFPFSGYKDAFDIYCEGWAEGVIHVWNQVTDKLNSNYYEKSHSNKWSRNRKFTESHESDPPVC